MANAQDIVKKGTVRRTDEFIKRPLAGTAVDRIFYPVSMIGTNAAGYLDKFDDTQPLTIAGVNRGAEGKFKQPVSNAGDLSLELQQPFRFEISVAGAVIGDLGKRVYALDDQTGTYSPGATVYANLVGTVVNLVAPGIVLVEPTYAQPYGNQMQVLANNGAIQIKPGVVMITKATAAALTLADPVAGLHDGMELVIISTTAVAHTVTNAGSGFNGLGLPGDVGTFGAANGNNLTIVAFQGKWYVKSSVGVTLG